MTRSAVRGPTRLAAKVAPGASLVLALCAAAFPAAPHASVTSFPGVLYGVSALSRSSAWAVGSYRTAGGPRLILHWNGTRWTTVPSPNPDHDGTLRAVSARSPSDAWAVGSYCTSNCGGAAVTQALTLRWNGRAWARVATPQPRGAVSTFLSGVTVLSQASAWAVGSYCRSASCFAGGPPLHPLMLHWNGTVWAVVSSPEPGGRYGTSLNAVTALSPSDAWAVGSYGTRPSHPAVCPGCPGRKSLVLHWNGRAWNKVASPSQGVPPDSNLSAVSAAASADALAAGWSYFYVPDEQNTLALRWAGRAWTRVASPSPGPKGDVFAFLSGVSALSPSSAWAVGSRITSTANDTLILRWNGSRWRRVASPDPGRSSGSSLNAVSMLSRSSAWAVGSGGGVLILHWNGTRWARA
jgi:hypothetical protein